jgi:putative ABC transport system permease protein
VSQVFESVKLALSSIWANKLRSLLTLLGNIVAVSSIVTVVSLIQGLNSTVSNAVVSDLGADTFTVDRIGMITNEEDMDRARNNPRITIEEAEAIERFSSNIESVMAQATTSAQVAYGNEELDSVRIQGVTG